MMAHMNNQMDMCYLVLYVKERTRTQQRPFFLQQAEGSLYTISSTRMAQVIQLFFILGLLLTSNPLFQVVPSGSEWR